jgi:hypothetical protein
MQIKIEQEQPNEQENKSTLGEWFRNTSYKILAIGAGLREFLRYTERIWFSPEPYREPDPQFVEELTAMLKELKNYE